MKKILFLLLPAFALAQITVGTTGGETHISSNTSWDGEVVMEGKIVVDAGATLTIAPGTLVKCKSSANPEDATVLVVAKGGMINAAGTAADPIVFTAFDAVANPEVQGKWGGIVVLGTAPIGEEGNNEKIEGIQGGATVTWNFYGGTDANDNSGTLQYVSIRHGGAIIAEGNELNGLTLGGVGAGTTIENIEIISNSDDGLECFGGNVDVTNLLVYNQGDDAVDIDEAYSGTVSNVVIHLGAASDLAFEIDGREDTNTAVDPSILTSISYTIDGVTVIGSGGTSDGGDQLGDWKKDATGVNKNIVYTNFANDEAIRGIDPDTYATGANDGANLTFENVDYVGGNTEDNILSGVSTATTSDAAWLEVLGTQTPGTGAAFGNFAWTYWSTFSSFANGTLSVELVDENVVSFTLYPNPFVNEINVASNKSIDVITIYNTVGQKVQEARNTNQVDVSSLNNGLYLIEVKADDSIYVGKMLK